MFEVSHTRTVVRLMKRLIVACLRVAMKFVHVLYCLYILWTVKSVALFLEYNLHVYSSIFYPTMTTSRLGICRRNSVCLSVVCLWRSCTLLRRLKFLAMFLRHFVPYPLTAMQNLTKIGPGEPLRRGLNAIGVAKYSDVEHVEGYILTRCKIRPRV